MKTNIDFDAALFDFFAHALLSVCAIFAVWPHEVLDRRRTEAVSRARHAIAHILRKHVSMRNGVGGWILSGVRPDGCVPLSTTKVGRLLRIDHSAVLYGSKFVSDDMAYKIS